MIDQELGSIFVLSLGTWCVKMKGNDDVEGTYCPMHHKQMVDWEDTLEECKMTGAMHAKAIVDSSNKGFMIYMFSMHQNLLIQSMSK